jgi:adenosylcobyric acid synthase
MGFAHAADVPVVLIGDIDRGHVIASLVGAHAVLDPADRDRIQGFLVNKFRGDPGLFDDGRSEIVRRTGWADLGMAPWIAAARRLPAEDAVILERPDARAGGRVVVAVPMLSRIANFDDFDPLRAEPGVDLRFVPPGRALPGDADLVILPGTKATLADLDFVRTQGWDIDLAAHVRRGGRVLGICGGYQMLGRRIADPDGVEGPPGAATGLGLLDVETVLTADKLLRPVTGHLRGGAFRGYEIHAGRTTGPGLARPLVRFADGVPDGAVSPDGRIAGTHVHGLFAAASARAAVLADLGAALEVGDYDAVVDAALDEIAGVLAGAFDVTSLSRIAGLPGVP